MSIRRDPGGTVGTLRADMFVNVGQIHADGWQGSSIKFFHQLLEWRHHERSRSGRARRLDFNCVRHILHDTAAALTVADSSADQPAIDIRGSSSAVCSAVAGFRTEPAVAVDLFGGNSIVGATITLGQRARGPNSCGWGYQGKKLALNGRRRRSPLTSITATAGGGAASLSGRTPNQFGGTVQAVATAAVRASSRSRRMAC